MRPATDRRLQSGVTLIEMIVAIVIGGILVAMVAMFGRWQIQSYFDVSNRAALTDAADTALRRISRDLQAALPNSVRVTENGTSQFLEFVPIADAGRYRADRFLSGTSLVGDILDFTSATDDTFQVLGPPVTIEANQQLVVYNLGIPALSGTSGSDVYQGYNRRQIPAGTSGTLSTVTFAPAGRPLPFASPANRFHVVSSPVSYECAPDAANPAAGRIIRHWCYDFLPAQPTGFSLSGYSGCGDSAKSAVLVDNVAACTITYQGAPALQRNGLVSISLSLSANGETVNLLHQVEVLNTP